MNTAAQGGLEAKLLELQRALARAARRLALLRAAWLAVAGLVALMALDAAFGLPDALRAALDLAAVLALAAAARAAYRAVAASPSPERRVARLAEDADPALGNRLVNAIDFREALGRGDGAGDLTGGLMRREIDAASAGAAAIRGAAFVTPPSLRTEARVLTGVAAAAVLLAAAFPRVFLATLPRVLLPGGDFPPYSATTLSLDPLRASVPYGESLAVEVQASGRRPAEVALDLCTPHGRPVARLPLYEVREGVYAQTLEHVTDDLRYTAVIPGGRSRHGRLTVLRVPRIDAARVRYDYPPYTRLRPVERYLADGRIRAYRGTRVTVRLTSNRPLAGGTLAAGGQALEMRPAAETNTVEAAFELREPLAFSATVRDVDGLWSRDRTEGRVELVPDEKPEVTVVNPPRLTFATPRAEVPINVESRDDLGVARVCLLRNLNGSPDAARTLHASTGERAFVNVIETLDLGDLGVRPGDTIEYYATATDSQPDAPATAASDVGRIVVVSDEDYAAFLRQQMTAEQLRESYDRLQAAIEELAEEQERLAAELRELESRVAAGGATDADRERLKGLRERQEQLAAQARALAERLARESRTPPVYDVERDYKRALEAFAGEVGEAAKQMGECAGRLGEAAAPGGDAAGACGAARKAQDAALRRLGRTGDAFDSGIGQAGRDIEKLFALYQDVETFKHLLGRQESLERQARFYVGRKGDLSLEDRVRLKELGAEEAAVRHELGALQAALREHAAGVTNDYPRVAADAQGIAAKIDELGIGGLMDRSAGALDALNGAEGHARALEALEAMRSMVKFCESAGGGTGSECEQRLRIVMNMSLGNTFAQLARRAGSGTGMGQGGVGRGDAGQGGAQPSPFGLYGGSDTLNAAADKSTGMGRGKARSTLPSAAAPVPATGYQEVSGSRKEGPAIEVGGGETMLDEYRDLITEYFRRMAEGSR